MNEDSYIIQVLFFAHLRELSGQQKINLEISASTDISTFKKILMEKFPRLKPAMDTIIIAINQQFAVDDAIIPDGAEVAIFPPVSGGAGQITICKIIEEPIHYDDFFELITQPNTGGICSFVGKVRAFTEGELKRQTVKLTYEAYGSMAEVKMNQICLEIRERWPKVDGIVMVQRIGTILPGETSVLVLCAAAHRDMGIFEASRYAIDRLKEIVPVWKKEVGPDGEEWIEGEYKPGEGD